MNKRYRILLVEDDPGHSQLIQDYLMMDPLYQVDRVDTIGLFWEAYQNFSYDLILMDYRLPDGTGLDALVELIARGGQSPVVMVTAQGDERIAAQAIQSGAVDYVVKRGDYILSLPSVINKSIQTHELNQSVQRSLEQIRYQAMILNNVRDAVVVWNQDGYITFWNTAASSLFECSAEERLGEHVSQFYFPVYDPPLAFPLVEIKEKEVERKGLTNTGKTIWISSRITELVAEDEDQLNIGCMDVIRDISERKQMEEKIRAAQARLIQIARLAAVGELSSGIAHRINNPLTTILGDSQVLLKNLPASDPMRESVEAIHEAGWNALQVVQSLIDFSAPVIEKLDPQAVNPTLEQAIILVGAQIQSRGISLSSLLEPIKVDVKADKSRLIDLWVNLLLQSRDIALKHDGKNILVRSYLSRNGNVVIEFRVAGVYLSQNLLADYFEPDFTGPISGFGTGMELTICREIVWQFGGQIAVVVDEKGSLFRVNLPSASENLQNT